jgi:hypothetical protein
LEVIVLQRTRQRVARIGLALGVLIAGTLVANPSAARRSFTLLRELVAELVGRVAAIEQTDCGCPGRFEPVCINGSRTYLNFCEAACVLARQGVGDFADMIQHGVPRGEVDLRIGQCERRVCDPNVCTDGACPRGFHCDNAFESGACGAACYCGPEPDSPRLCTRAALCLPVCVPDEPVEPLSPPVELP